jgi:predicted porin
LESGGVSGSRWGFKGSEDLGGGLKANFNLEQGFDLSNGKAATTGVAFSRQAWAGFSGGFGEVKFGRSGTAYDDILGTNNNTFDSALTARPWVGYAATVSNQLYYAAPNINGFTGALSYALGEDKSLAVGAADAGSILALNVQYAKGPFMVGYAFQQENSGNALGLGAIAGLSDAVQKVGLPAITTPAGSKATYNLITGSYDLGVATLLGSYNTTKLELTGAGTDVNFKEFQLGANIPVAKNTTLAVGYGESKADAGGDIYKAKAYSAAVAYSLSKRTTAYAGFNVTTVTFDPTNVVDAEVKSNTYAIGVKHTF